MTAVSAGPDGAFPAPSGPGDLAYQKCLQESQWWSADRLLEHQAEALERLVTHAWRTVPFHRPRLEAAGLQPGRPFDLACWRRLARLTRRDIQRAGAALQSTAPPLAHGRVITTTTSGSTGTPITVWGTVFDAVVGKAITLRHFLWHPHDFTGTLAAIRRVKGQIYQFPHGRVQTRWGDTGTFPFSTGPAAILSIAASIAQQAEWLVRQDPDYLMTYPSNLRFLADHCRERGIAVPHLESVTSFGEVLSPETRQACRLAWDLPVVDVYSAQEVGPIALQCPGGQQYHVQSEAIMVEVLDECGNPCAPGQTGRVVVTPLHNYATPLLRYEIGDYTEVGEPCACGRGLPVLRRILGRERNALLVAASGERYWPAFGSRRLTQIAPIVQHQFVQKSLEHLEARLVTRRPLTRSEEGWLRTYLRAALPPGFEVTFAYYDEIPRNASDKFENFVCEVST